jgi:hypothetical protein
MIRDHVQFSDGKVVISGGRTDPACSVPDEGYVMAHVRLEINTAGSDLEIVASLVFDNCVAAKGATQATLNAGLVSIDARRGSLCKPQRDQHGRCNDQQQCFLHETLRRFSPCGGLKFRLGLILASDF